MICLTVHLTVKAGREQETADMFRSYVKLVQTEPGCMRFDVQQSRKDPRRFLLYELYRDDGALDAHRRTPHFLDYSPKIEDLASVAKAESTTTSHDFPPVDEQLAYLKGRGGDHPRNRIARAPRTIGENWKAVAGKSGFRSHCARSASWPYRAHPQTEALSGPGAHGHLPDRRLHRPDWRSHRRSATRKPLTQEEIDANAETYKEQVFKILDPEKTVVDFNRRWFSKFSATDFIRLAAKYTVSQLLEREDFHARFRRSRSRFTNCCIRWRMATTPWRWKPMSNLAAPIRNSICSLDANCSGSTGSHPKSC